MPATHSSTHRTSHRKSASRSAAAKRAAATRAKAAIPVLKADHREVEKDFGRFFKASGQRKLQLCRKICLALKVHTEIEEEIFYPACRDVLRDDEIVNEALVEHQGAKDLIAQIEGMDASDEMFEARMQVLCEQIEHHVKEEEGELFPRVQKSDMDMQAIGERLSARKQALMTQLQGDGMQTH